MAAGARVHRGTNVCRMSDDARGCSNNARSGIPQLGCRREPWAECEHFRKHSHGCRRTAALDVPVAPDQSGVGVTKEKGVSAKGVRGFEAHRDQYPVRA